MRGCVRVWGAAGRGAGALSRVFRENQLEKSPLSFPLSSPFSPAAPLPAPTATAPPPPLPVPAAAARAVAVAVRRRRWWRGKGGWRRQAAARHGAVELGVSECGRGEELVGKGPWEGRRAAIGGQPISPPPPHSTHTRTRQSRPWLDGSERESTGPQARHTCFARPTEMIDEKKAFFASQRPTARSLLSRCLLPFSLPPCIVTQLCPPWYALHRARSVEPHPAAAGERARPRRGGAHAARAAVEANTAPAAFDWGRPHALAPASTPSSRCRQPRTPCAGARPGRGAGGYGRGARHAAPSSRRRPSRPKKKAQPAQPLPAPHSLPPSSRSDRAGRCCRAPRALQCGGEARGEQGNESTRGGSRPNEQPKCSPPRAPLALTPSPPPLPTAPQLRHRPPPPSRRPGSPQAQAQAPRPVPQLLLHGRQVPGLLPHHHRVLQRADRRRLPLLLRRAVHADRGAGAADGGVFVPAQGGLRGGRRCVVVWEGGGGRSSPPPPPPASPLCPRPPDPPVPDTLFPQTGGSPYISPTCLLFGGCSGGGGWRGGVAAREPRCFTPPSLQPPRPPPPPPVLLFFFSTAATQHCVFFNPFLFSCSPPLARAEWGVQKQNQPKKSNPEDGPKNARWGSLSHQAAV